MDNTNQKIYLGNIHGDHCHDGFGGAVFDPRGISPIIMTCQGGGREPHIIVYEEYEQREEDR